MCKVVPKLTVSTSHLTRIVSKDIGDPIVILPSIRAVPPAMASSGVSLKTTPPPTSKPVVASKARRRQSKAFTDDTSFWTVTGRVIKFPQAAETPSSSTRGTIVSNINITI